MNSTSLFELIVECLKETVPKGRLQTLGKREVYVTDEGSLAVDVAGSAELRNGIDLSYLTGQRPSDALQMTKDDIVACYRIVNQGKTEESPDRDFGRASRTAGSHRNPLDAMPDHPSLAEE